MHPTHSDWLTGDLWETQVQKHHNSKKWRQHTKMKKKKKNIQQGYLSNPQELCAHSIIYHTIQLFNIENNIGSQNSIDTCWA